MKWFMAALLGFGGVICCLNFYLSFVRYPIHRLMGKSKEDYRWVSGFPFGSLIVAVSLFEFWRQPWPLALSIIFILIDTGGFHWFIGSMLYHKFFHQETLISETVAGTEKTHR